MTAPSKLLLDTNVWLDLFSSDRPGRRDALRLVDWATEQDALLLFAASTVKDLYYILKLEEKRKLRADTGAITPAAAQAIDEYAWGCIHAMEEIATVVPIDQSDLWIAEKYRFLHSDFEDNLILAAAVRAKADFLVTSDKALLAKSPLATLNPSDMLGLVEV